MLAFSLSKYSFLAPFCTPCISFPLLQYLIISCRVWNTAKREKQGERERQRETERDRDRERQRETETERDEERERGTDRQTETDTDRETETERRQRQEQTDRQKARRDRERGDRWRETTNPDMWAWLIQMRSANSHFKEELVLWHSLNWFDEKWWKREKITCPVLDFLNSSKSHKRVKSRKMYAHPQAGIHISKLYSHWRNGGFLPQVCPALAFAWNTWHTEGSPKSERNHDMHPETPESAYIISMTVQWHHSQTCSRKPGSYDSSLQHTCTCKLYKTSIEYLLEKSKSGCY